MSACVRRARFADESIVEHHFVRTQRLDAEIESAVGLLRDESTTKQRDFIGRRSTDDAERLDAANPAVRFGRQRRPSHDEPRDDRGCEHENEREPPVRTEDSRGASTSSGVERLDGDSRRHVTN